MNREEAIVLARTYAKAYPQSYYSEPFEPHEWVIESILAAANRHLTKWATHKVYCEKSLSKGTVCQCGLDDALAGCEP